MLLPATSANDTAVPVTDVPEALSVCVAARALIVMLDAPVAKLMLLAAIRVTLLDVPFSEKFVAAEDTETVIVERLEANPMPAPATSDTDDELAFKLKLVALGTLGPMIVSAGFVLSWESVILDPATMENADDDAVLAVPLDAPPAAVVIERSVE